MGSQEVRYRKKGTKTWKHDRIPGKKNVYGGKPQKKDAHRTFKNKADADAREKQLRKKLGPGYEYSRKTWGGRRH